MSASLSRRLSAFFGSALDQGPKAAKFAALTPGRASTYLALDTAIITDPAAGYSLTDGSALY